MSKYLCDIEKANKVLDFSAGWGDRLTGFLASSHVKEIHLIDPRSGSMDACLDQYNFIESTKKLYLHQAPAEEELVHFPSCTLDLIVSSPPYFNLEKYGETDIESKGQIRLRVSDVGGYVDCFLRPVLIHCARILKQGGLLALNLDDNVRLRMFICRHALEIASEIPSLSFIGTAGIRKGTGFGASTKDRTKSKAEPVYMWRKEQTFT